MRKSEWFCASIKEVEGDVEQFRCEDAPDVEAYLKQYALLHHQQNTTHTRLIFDDVGELIGFFTVVVDLVEVGKGKRREQGWDLDERYGIFPAVKIHYVAVDSRQRRLGYGREILGHAITWCREIAEHVGCNFITIEAKREREGFFKLFGFDYCSRKPLSAITADGAHVNMCLFLGAVSSAQTASPQEITV